LLPLSELKTREKRGVGLQGQILVLLVFSVTVYAKNFGNASPNSTPMTSANTQDLTIMGDEDSNLNKATDLVSQTIHKAPN
jgi:hypothetical protein